MALRTAVSYAREKYRRGAEKYRLFRARHPYALAAAKRAAIVGGVVGALSLRSRRAVQLSRRLFQEARKFGPKGSARMGPGIGSRANVMTGGRGEQYFGRMVHLKPGGQRAEWRSALDDMKPLWHGPRSRARAAAIASRQRYHRTRLGAQLTGAVGVPWAASPLLEAHGEARRRRKAFAGAPGQRKTVIVRRVKFGLAGNTMIVPYRYQR